MSQFILVKVRLAQHDPVTKKAQSREIAEEHLKLWKIYTDLNGQSRGENILTAYGSTVISQK